MSLKLKVAEGVVVTLEEGAYSLSGEGSILHRLGVFKVPAKTLRDKAVFHSKEAKRLDSFPQENIADKDKKAVAGMIKQHARKALDYHNSVRERALSNSSVKHMKGILGLPHFDHVD